MAAKMTWAADPNAPFGSAAQASCVDPARAPRPAQNVCQDCKAASSPGLCAPCNLLRTSLTKQMVELKLAERMRLVGKEIIGQSRPIPAPVCYGGTGTGFRAKPVLIRFPSPSSGQPGEPYRHTLDRAVHLHDPGRSRLRHPHLAGEVSEA